MCRDCATRGVAALTEEEMRATIEDRQRRNQGIKLCRTEISFVVVVADYSICTLGVVISVARTFSCNIFLSLSHVIPIHVHLLILFT